MDLQDIICALQSTDEEIRRSALYSLRKNHDSDAQSIIFTAMGDESWRVRKEAVDTYIYSAPDLNSVEQLLNLLRNEDNAGLRNSAAEAVIRLGSMCASPLIKLVQDQDADVRKFVIDVMGAINDRIFVPSLLQALNDNEVNVASAAAEQLGSLGAPEAAEHLMRAVLERDEVLFRFSALDALGKLAQPSPVPQELLKLADQDILKKAVFDCLGSIADEHATTLLLEGFSCRQKKCRAAAVKALFKIFRRAPAEAQKNIREELHLLNENDIVFGLVELFDKRDVVLAEALLWTSVAIKDARFIPLLIEAYSDERTADAALSALKSFDYEALQEIVSRYTGLDEVGRCGLCLLIAECNYSGFNEIIKLGLRDQSGLVRAAAAMAVGKLGLVSSLPDLVLLVDDNDSNVYEAAVVSLQSLIIMCRSAVLSEVGHFSSSTVSRHRKAAAHLLASLGEQDGLLLLLKDEDPDVRKAAVTALGANHLESSGSLLVLTLADENSDVRIAVADALGNSLEPSYLDALEHALIDEDVWVQSAVLKAIAKIDPARALSIIENIHTSSDGLLLITCLKLLEEIGGPQAEEIIRSAFKNSDQDIVRQAVISLARII